MEVQPTKINASQKKISPQEELKAKLKAKFGDKFKSGEEKNKEIRAARKEEQALAAKAEISDKAKKKASVNDSEGFGDVKKNDPASELTQEKLKAILKNGGFDFNDKEKEALGSILK